MRAWKARFEPHVPTEAQKHVIKDITESFILLAEKLEEWLPAGPERVVAIRKLLDAKMQATMALFDTGEA